MVSTVIALSSSACCCITSGDRVGRYPHRSCTYLHAAILKKSARHKLDGINFTAGDHFGLSTWVSVEETSYLETRRQPRVIGVMMQVVNDDSGKQVSTVCSQTFSTPTVVGHQERDLNSQDTWTSVSLGHNGSLLTSTEGLPFRCNICGESFDNQSKFQRHRHAHVEVDTFKCTVCPKTFRTVEDMEQHKVIHKTANPFSCDLCSEAFKTRSELLKHQTAKHSGESQGGSDRSANETQRHVCSYCYKACKSRSQLVEHERIHTNEKPFDCQKCGKAFNQQSSLKRHMVIHTKKQKPYPCTKCGTHFKSYYFLSKHRQSHKDRPHTCRICKKMYTTANSLQKHKKRHVQDEFICATCNKKFRSHLKLREHIETHKSEQRHGTGRKAFKMATYHRPKQGQLSVHKAERLHARGFRPKSFKRISDRGILLGTHAKAKAPHRLSLASPQELSARPPERVYSCGTCSNSFETFYRMRKHKQMHQDRPHMCRMCEETFVSMATLVQHQQTSCVESYACDACTKTFTTETALDRHKMKHILERPYLCGVCLKSFKTTSELEAHLFSHTGKKPHACQTCNKKFTRASRLERHQQICKEKRIRSVARRSTTEENVAATATGSSLRLVGRIDDEPTSQSGSQTVKGRCADNNSFVCSVCGKTMRSSSRLQDHERVHTNERPFSCDDCGRAFKRRHTLKLHRQTHRKRDAQNTVMLEKGSRTGTPSGVEQHAEPTTNQLGVADVTCLESVVTGSSSSPSLHLVDSTTASLHFSRFLQNDSNCSGQADLGDVSTSSSQCNRPNEVHLSALTIQSFLVGLESNHELEVRRKSHDIQTVEASTSNVRMQDLGTIPVMHSTGPAGHQNPLAISAESVQVVSNDPGTELSDSDCDIGLPDPSSDGEELLELSCTEVFSPQETIAPPTSEPEVDCVDETDVQVPSTQNVTKSCMSQLIASNKTLQIVINKIQFYTCSICKKVFQMSTELDEHKMTHQEQVSSPKNASSNCVEEEAMSHQGRSFPCRFCDKVFIQKAKLSEHERVHTGEKPYKCNECNQTFSHGSTLRRHQISVHQKVFPRKVSSQLLKCDICGKLNKKRSALVRHMSTHSDKRPYKCDGCERAYKQKSHLKVHQATCTGKTSGKSLKNTPKDAQDGDASCTNPTAEETDEGHKLSCRFCGKVCKNQAKLQKHKRIHLKERPYDKMTHQVHVSSSGNAAQNCVEKAEVSHEGGSFSCRFCGKVFIHKTKLSEHERVHTGEKPYKCNECNQTFSQGSTLRRHQISVHQKDFPWKVSSQLLKCDICGKLNKKRSALVRHMSTHSDKRPYKCDGCERAYKQKSHLNVHQATCTGKTSGKSLKNTPKDAQDGDASCTNPIPEETDEGHKLSCRFCGKVFIHKTKLSEHERVHTGEKPYKCNECVQTFSQGSTLRRHQMSVHQKDFSWKVSSKLLKCDICGKLNKKRSALVRHMSTHSDKRPYKCDRCERAYKHKPHLNVHQATCTGKTSGKSLKNAPKDAQDGDASCTNPIPEETDEGHMLSCRSCGKVCKNKAKLQKHERIHKMPHQVHLSSSGNAAQNCVEKAEVSHKGGSFSCRFCGKAFIYKARLLEHERVHTGEKPYKCNECNQTFSHGSTLRRHQISVHQKVFPRKVSSQLLKCDICGKLNKKRSALVRHMSTHSDKRPNKCDGCERAYKQKSQLKVHQATCTGKTSGNSLKNTPKDAQDGDASCTNPTAEETDEGQQRKDSDEVSGQTAESDSSVKTSQNSQQDDATMEEAAGVSLDGVQQVPGTKQFSCRFCDKCFSHESELSKHERCHTKKKAYKCEECDHTFSHISNLRKHLLRLHTCKKLMLKCFRCHRAFYTKRSLASHLAIHTDQRPHKCDHCDKAYKHKHHLKAHKVLHHPQVSSTENTSDPNMTRENSQQSDVTAVSSTENTSDPNMTRENSQQSDVTAVSSTENTSDPNMTRENSQQSDVTADDTQQVPGTTKSQYSCMFCGKICGFRARLLEHERSHTKEKPFKCEECEEAFSYCYSLKSHMTRKHGKELTSQRFAGGSQKDAVDKQGRFKDLAERSQKCHNCGKMYANKSALTNHLASHKRGGQGPHKCDRCDKAYKHKHHLTAHMVVHLSQGTSREAVSNTENTSDPSIMTENSQQSEVAANESQGGSADDTQHLPGTKAKFSCTFCGKICACRAKLLEHERSHTKEKPFKCEECEEAFSYGNSLRSHMIRKHDKEFASQRFSGGSRKDAVDKQPEACLEAVQKCHSCGKMYEKSALNIHLASHTDHRPHKCDGCDKAYKHNWHLKEHKIICKGKVIVDSVETASSSQEGENSELSGNRANEQRGTRPTHTCGICGKICIYRKKLEAHMRRHTKEKPYQCGECQQCFSHAGSLQSHMKTHHSKLYVKTTLFQCDICQDCFKIKARFENHMMDKHRIYRQVASEGSSQQQPDQEKRCSVCIDGFNSLSTLKNHTETIHSNEKRYRCTACEKTYLTVRKLKRHYIKMHTNIREFKCQSCDKGFFKKSELVQHERTHTTNQTGLNPLTCDGMETRSIPESSSNEDGIEEEMHKHVGYPSTAKGTTSPEQGDKPSSHQCEQCFKKCLTIRHLREHYLRAHTDIRPYQCDFCGKRFCKRLHFIQHKETHEISECSLCGEDHIKLVEPPLTFSRDTVYKRFKSGYTRFLESHKVKKQASSTNKQKQPPVRHPRRFQCTDCAGSFSKMSCFTLHRQMHKTSAKPIYCRLCGKHFQMLESLHRHRLMFHYGRCSGKSTEDMNRCESCGEKFPEMRSLIGHLASSHSKPRPFSCEDCTACFPTPLRLGVHKELMHPTGKLSLFVCTICNKAFQWKYLLRNHSGSHRKRDSTKEFNCTICSKTFKTELCLFTHNRSYHGQEKFMCDVCGKLLHSSRALINHGLVHSDKRECICERCGKGFKTLKALSFHGRRTPCNTTQVFTCETCGKTFPLKRFLGVHARSHRDKRRKCKYCNKVFAKQGFLTIHLRVHTNFRPYSCKMCDKRFRTRGVMLQHQNTHTGEKPFKCKICGADFASNGSLYNHKRVHQKKRTPVRQKGKAKRSGVASS